MWHTDGNWIKRQDGTLVATVMGNWTGNYSSQREQSYAAKIMAAAPEMALSLKTLWSRANQGEMPTNVEMQQVAALLRRIDAR